MISHGKWKIFQFQHESALQMLSIAFESPNYGVSINFDKLVHFKALIDSSKFSQMEKIYF